jgi:hypothetical protein
MLPGKALTTAMGILPHIDLPMAQQLALSLDIPFWPQLPHLRFREGYVRSIFRAFSRDNY